MKFKNAFWGLLFILAGVLVVVGQVTSFATLSFWTVLGAIVFSAGVITNLVKLNFTGTLFSAALLYIVLQKPLHFFYIAPWVLMLAAVLAGAGLSMIFRRRPRYDHNCYTCIESGEVGDYPSHDGSHNNMTTEENDDDNRPFCKVSFGGTTRYLRSTALEYGQFYASFGAMGIYLDQAQLAPQGAEIFCDASFSAIKLYVPRNWKVVDQINTSMGGVDNDTRMAQPDPNLPVLTLTGNAQFGAIEVKYV